MKGQDLYENHYQHDDHLQIARLLRDVQVPWVVSYDFNPANAALYKRYPSIVYGINYSAQDRNKGSESMFFSRQLIIPEVRNPAKVRAA